MAVGLLCALGAAVLYGVAAVLQAAGARRVPWSAGLDPRVMLSMLKHPQAMVALVLLLVGFVMHLAAVRMLPLFLAQAGIAVSLVVSALTAVVAFGERLRWVEWTAVAAVFVGLVLLSASAGGIGQESDPWLSFALLGALAVSAVLAWPASQRRTAASTAALGVLSGAGYAVVGVAARLLPGMSSELVVAPATYVLLLAGVLAFFLYTLALQRGAVMLATTPVIVTQTVVPAAIGLIWLGDAVRPGWMAGAVTGFCLTVIAALFLVRFEAAEALPGDRENSGTVIG